MKKPKVWEIALVVGVTMLLLVAASAYLRQSSKIEDPLIPFLSSQVEMREAMVSGLRTHDLDAFCDAYMEFKRIAKEEPLLPEGAKPIAGEKDGLVVLLLVVDSQLIRELADLSECCEGYCPY